MREEILAWLKEGCNLNKGVALYLQYGDNDSFKAALKTNAVKVQKRLKHLLCAMAGTSISNESKEVDKTEKDRFRQMYPFLDNRNIPSELKILATDKMTTYWDMVKLHDQLFVCHTNADCFDVARRLVTAFKEDQAIKAELDHFRDFGKVLGKHRIFDKYKRLDSLRMMSTRDLIRKEQQLLDNIWRIKSELAKGDKPHLVAERNARLEDREKELIIVRNLIGE